MLVDRGRGPPVRRLFAKRRLRPILIVPRVTADGSSPAVSSNRLVSRAAGRSDVGRVRDHNEDRLLLSPKLDLYVVADGMGGHNAGEVASALTTLSLENCFDASQHTTLPPEIGEDPRPLSHSARRLVAAVRKANSDVFEISSTHSEHKGMGTTVVALHYCRPSNEVHVAHVGDSRCYRIRGGKMEQLTRDHSLVGDALAWKPDLSEAELALLPKNVISRALGRAKSVEIDVRTEPAEAGDLFLICSDGLSGMVNDAGILQIVQSTPDLQQACVALLAAANEAGGTDNATVVLVRLDPDDGSED